MSGPATPLALGLIHCTRCFQDCTKEEKLCFESFSKQPRDFYFVFYNFMEHVRFIEPNKGNNLYHIVHVLIIIRSRVMSLPVTPEGSIKLKHLCYNLHVLRTCSEYSGSPVLPGIHLPCSCRQ